MNKQKLIILDRDGVINHDSDHYIKCPDEWLPIDGSIEAIARLKRAGYIVAVATNQSGLGRGYYNINTLNEIHDKLHQLLKAHDVEIDHISYCPHLPDAGCDCRKPKPGMLLAIADKFGQSLEGVFFVGDTLGDIRAARATKAQPIMVLSGKGKRTALLLDDSHHDLPIYDNLSAVVDALLSQDLT